MASSSYLRNVVTLELDRDRCNGCAMCTAVCPHSVFELVDKRSRIHQRDACMECGACQTNCPEGAISVRHGTGCAYAELNALFRRSGE